jgi:two-component system NtrC family sensor kinase
VTKLSPVRTSWQGRKARGKGLRQGIRPWVTICRLRRVATKIFLAFGVSLAAFALVSAFGIVRLHDLGRKLRLLSAGYLPLTRVAAQIEVKDWVTPRVLEAWALDPAARRAWIPLARARFPALVREKIAEGRAVAARAAQGASGEEAAFLSEVTGRLDALDAAWSRYDTAARALLDAVEAGQVSPPETAIQTARTLEKSLAIDVKLLQAALESHTSELLLVAEREESRTVASIVIYTLLALSVGAGAALVSQRLLAPIRTLTEGVKGVASGDLTRQVDVRGVDELGVLAREFNAMAASLERQRQELLRAERLAAVGRISAHITHEIRNPLNSLGLNAELLAEELEPGASAEARALVLAITREVDRLNAVAEEYLRFARLPRLVMAREDLNEIVGGLLDFVAPEMQAAGVQVERGLAPDLPAIRGDEGQLRAALLNLLRNSREALAGGGTIRVRTVRTPDGGAEVAVGDTGPGIPPEQLEKIFDPFYSTKSGGTGLGLAFTLQVVQEHGGTIQCQSEKGRGTTFAIRLPPAPPDGVTTQEAHHT